MCGPIYYFIELILGVLLDFTLDTIYKDPRFSKTIMQKSFEFISCNKYGDFALKLAFVLLLVKKNLILKKCQSKKDII